MTGAHVVRGVADVAGTPWWGLLTEPWQYEFMQRALLVTVVASVVCALLSCWLVLIGWSLMGDAVAHAERQFGALTWTPGGPPF